MPRPPYILSPDGRTREGATVPPAALPPLQLEGADLTFIRIDHQVRLQFGDCEVVIETMFRLTSEGSMVLLHPAEREGLGALLRIYPTTLRAATVDADLTLRLEFAGHTTLEVAQDDAYEAWQINGPASRLVVCPPGGSGRLAVWT